MGNNEQYDLSKYIDLAGIPKPKQIVPFSEIMNDTDRNYEVIVHQHIPEQTIDNDKYLGKTLLTDTEELQERLKAGRVTLPPSYTATIENLRVMGLGGLMITPDNKIIKDSIVYCDVPGTSHRCINTDMLLNGPELVPAPQYIDNAVAVVGSRWPAYGHNFIEDVMTIGTYDGLKLDYIYSAHYAASPFLRDSYKFLGINPSRVMCAKPFHQLMFKRAHIHMKNSFMANLGLKKIFANKLLKSLNLDNIKPFRKIFYIRNPKNNSCQSPRFMENATEVAALLRSKGFEQICWENLSFKDKIRLAAETEVSVDEYGSQYSHYRFFADNISIVQPVSSKIIDSYSGCLTGIWNEFLENNIVSYLTCPTVSGEGAGDIYRVDIDRLDSAVNEQLSLR